MWNGRFGSRPSAAYNYGLGFRVAYFLPLALQNPQRKGATRRCLVVIGSRISAHRTLCQCRHAPRAKDYEMESTNNTKWTRFWV